MCYLSATGRQTFASNADFPPAEPRTLFFERMDEYDTIVAESIQNSDLRPSRFPQFPQTAGNWLCVGHRKSMPVFFQKIHDYFNVRPDRHIKRIYKFPNLPDSEEIHMAHIHPRRSIPKVAADGEVARNRAQEDAHAHNEKK